FPEAGRDVRDMILAILAEVFSVGINHGGGVVIDACNLFFIDRHDDDHAMLLRNILKQFDGWAVRYFLDRIVPARLLLGAEVRSVEDLLHAENLHTLTSSVLNHFQVLINIRALDLLNRSICRRNVGGLDKSAFDSTWHINLILL